MSKRKSGLRDDEIKRLEHELERCRKKIADDRKENDLLWKMLERANKGNQETQAMVDAILTAVTLRCGEDAVDPDDESKVLGKRLTLPRFNVQETRSRYEVHARKDGETGGYVIGVVERDGYADHAGDKDAGAEAAT